jgi:hypothetical protein
LGALKRNVITCPDLHNRTAEEPRPGWTEEVRSQAVSQGEEVFCPAGQGGGREGGSSVRTGAPASRARGGQGGGNQAEGAGTQARSHRQGASGFGHRGGEAHATRGRAACPDRGHREEGPSRRCELGRGSEAVEGGPAAGTGLRSAAQECVNQPRFLPKKICADLLKLFPDFQILSASPIGDRDAVRVPPLETGTGSVRCRS